MEFFLIIPGFGGAIIALWKIYDSISTRAELLHNLFGADIRPFAKNNFRNSQKRLVRLFESLNTLESLVSTIFPIPTLAHSKSLRLQWIADVTTKRFGVLTPCIFC